MRFHAWDSKRIAPDLGTGWKEMQIGDLPDRRSFARFGV